MSKIKIDMMKREEKGINIINEIFGYKKKQRPKKLSPIRSK